MTELIDAVDVRPASPLDTEAMVGMSTGPITGKRSFIVESFERRSVIGAYTRSTIVGYTIWDRAFFGRPFVWLLGVDPAVRRRGIAATLLRAFAQQCAGEPLFTSTNESNGPMQALLARSGFVRSGLVENLDPGDPEIFYFQPPARVYR